MLSVQKSKSSFHPPFLLAIYNPTSDTWKNHGSRSSAFVSEGKMFAYPADMQRSI